MITVTIVRNADKRITSFKIKGHAKYAKLGKDIVCAGVSAISVGTVNSVEALADVKLPYVMDNGWLSSDIPVLADQETNHKVQLLLESMIVMLNTIAQSYGKYVVIKQQSLE